MVKLTQSLKVFSMLMLCILFVNMVSALEINPFADKKIYEPILKEDTSNFLKDTFNEKYGIIRLSKTLFWFETDKIAEYSLIKNTEICINCEQIIKATLYKDMPLFEKMDYKKLIGDKGIKNQKVLILTKEEYQEEISIFQNVCKILKENDIYGNKAGTEICEDKIISYQNQTKKRDVWKEYNGEILKAGDYQYKIVGEIETGQKIDVVQTTNGKSFDEWATWTSADCIGTGGDITIDGDYCVHTFTTDGTFGLKNNINITNASTLIVAGGGGGGATSTTGVGGGGGAGGLIYNASGINITSNQSVTVGDGGAGQTGLGVGASGGNSVFNGYTAIGGGGGGHYNNVAGVNGGSGGGGGQTSGAGGLGTAGQGNDGSAGNGGSSGGGGGGYATAGTLEPNNYGGHGGNGSAFNINGSSVYYAGGGGGGGYSVLGGTGGTGGLGGGGNGYATVTNADNGVDGLGGGGGASRDGADGGSGGDGVVIVRYLAGGLNALTITLNNPENNYNSSTQEINFNCSATDETGIYSLNLTINGTVYETITGDGTTNLSLSSTETLADGYWEWYCTGNDDFETKNSTTRSLLIDSTSPTISSAYNLTDLITLILPINSTWHFNATDTHIESCYYNTTDHAQTIVTCNSTINTTWATEGNKTIQFCANDTFGFETCDTQNIYIYYIQEDQGNNPETIAEGFEATFNLTVNLTNIPTTTATLIINNTIYSPDTTTAGTNGYFFEKTITIPDGWGNTTGILQDWYWNYTINGVITNKSTDTDNITVYELAIDDCSSYGDMILNFSLNDEETNILVNESAGANVEIDLTLTSKTNSAISLTYSNTWTNENNPQVCLPNNVLNNSQYWLDLVVGFSSTDHVWEFYYLDDGTLNSSKIIQDFNGDTTSDISLMDLLTADSTSFLFNYFDQDGLAVDEAIVHVMRKYIGSGQFLEVERAKADENGDTIVHLVEEDVIYFFYITQYGELIYTSSTYTALCQATPCRIQLEASGSGATFPTDWDLIDGGAYSIASDPSTREVNLTYALNSTSTMNLTVFKYNSDGSYSPINSSTSTGTQGSILMTVPQSAGNVSFFATVYQDDEFKNSEWVDFEGKAQDRFGVTLALFIGALIILSLGLMAITEGVGTLVFVLLGVALSGFLGLVTTTLSTGVNIVVYLVVAGGILLWKLTGGRR